MCKKRFEIKATCFDKRGKIISVGYNSYKKSHPIQSHFARLAGLPEKVFLHAEIAALLKARGKDVEKIKVERYDSKGNPVNAAPCPVCQLAIKNWGVSYVEHTV